MNLLNKLKGGDLRSIGEADKVVDKIGNNQRLFDEIFNGIFVDDPLIRMRASDVAEKVSQNHPHLLTKHKKRILHNLNKFEQQELKWHFALMLTYIQLTEKESEKVYTVLSKWAKKDKSKIVRVNSLQALTDIALGNNLLKSKVIALIKSQIINGSPAIISRGMKLLESLK